MLPEKKSYVSLKNPVKSRATRCCLFFSLAFLYNVLAVFTYFSRGLCYQVQLLGGEKSRPDSALQATFGSLVDRGQREIKLYQLINSSNLQPL